MSKTFIYLTALFVLLTGVAVEGTVHHNYEQTPHVEEPPADELPVVGEGFVLDVSEMLPAFEDIAEDDREDQVADWAVYGALMEILPSGEAFRDATFDLTPVRLPELSDLYAFAYGSGRRVIRGDDTVWLFVAEDDANATVTLARMADQVRMETGEIPERFVIFRHRIDFSRAELSVTRTEDIPGTRMFSDEYGYSDRLVTHPEHLDEVLGHIDDVTFVRRHRDGVVVGGRRFDRDCAPGQERGPGLCFRTKGVTLEDIAALYQAHQRLAEKRLGLESRIRQIPVVIAYDELVDAFNAEVDRRNQIIARGRDPGLGESTKVHRLLEKVRHALDEAPTARDHAGTFEGQAKVIQRLGERVEAAQIKAVEQLIASEGVFPEEPGFSLDPAWRDDRLANDIETIVNDAASLIDEAEEFREQAREDFEGDASVERYRAAQHVHEAVFQHKLNWGFDRLATLIQSVHIQSVQQLSAWLDSQGEALDMPAMRQRLLAATRDLRAEDESQVAKGHLALAQIKSDLRNTDDRRAELLGGLVEFAQARNALQCARYDGPLEGTAVGMTLFYTDAMAKIWQAVDYYHSAPTDEIEGFVSAPRIMPDIEPSYWAEMLDKPATRIWFGTREDRFRMIDGSTLSFAAIATRVYAAGSNELTPDEESSPSEPGRRSIGWWDRHFDRVANYEGEYHRQNQIMKWSVITGWMAQGGLVDLTKVPVSHEWLFPQWYSTHLEQLRYRLGLRILPPEEWVGETECMDRLVSYPYDTMGQDEGGWTYGGVSLGGSARTLTKVKLDKAIPKVRLRSGYAGRGAELATGRGVAFRLPKAQAGRIKTLVKPTSQGGQNIHFRAGGAQMPSVKAIESHVNTSIGRVRVTLTTNSGRSLGRVKYQRGLGRGRMSWERGALREQMVRQHDQLRIATEAEYPAAALSRAKGASASDGAYVIENGGTTEILWPVEQHAGSNALAGTTRVTKIGPTLGDQSGFDVVATKLTQAHAQMLHAGSKTADATLSHLRAQPWQHLNTGNGTVGRVFTQRGPAQTARKIELHTGDPRLETVEAYVEGRTLVLKRPQNPSAQTAFDDLVTRQAIEAQSIEAVLESNGAAVVLKGGAQGAQATARPLLTSQSPSLVLDTLSIDGNAAATLRSIRESALDFAPKSMLGQRSPVAEAFVRAERVSANELHQALTGLQRGDIGKTVQATRALADQGKLAGVSPRSGISNAAEISRYAAANGRSTVGKLSLEASGNRAKMVLTLDEGVSITPVGGATRPVVAAQIRSGQAQVYIKEGTLLKEIDWMMRPGSSLAKAIPNRNIKWIEINLKDSLLLPSEILQGNQVFRRIPLAAKPQSSGLARRLAPAGAPPVIYLLSQSDEPQEVGPQPSVAEAG